MENLSGAGVYTALTAHLSILMILVGQMLLSPTTKPCAVGITMTMVTHFTVAVRTEASARIFIQVTPNGKAQRSEARLYGGRTNLQPILLLLGNVRCHHAAKEIEKIIGGVHQALNVAQGLRAVGERIHPAQIGTTAWRDLKDDLALQTLEMDHGIVGIVRGSA